MHIIDKINASSSDESHVIFSLEFFTPKYPKSSSRSQINDSFISKVSHMAGFGASYCDITWRPTSAASTLSLAARMQTEIPIETMMHLTCLGMSAQAIDQAVDSCRKNGVANIMALRGDPIKGEEEREKGIPSCGLDLVESIRSKHGDFFGLAVAGYPEAHPNKIPEGSDVATGQGYKEDLIYLKQKVDAGADFIVTQLFFDTSIFLKFVKDCRRVGIECPIVPGILPIVSYRSFQTMTTICKTKVPSEIRNKVEELKTDEPALLAYGVDLAAEMCTEILRSGVRELHFYTMNRDEPVMKILQRLGLLKGGENGVVPRVLEEKEEKKEEKKLVAV